MKKYIIILAAGKGSRLGTDIAKQFLLLEDKPILLHTIDKFLNNLQHQFEIILVLNKEHLQLWEKYCLKFNYNNKFRIVIGGTERFHSVKNALDTITDQNCYIGIHDGVRPFVNEDVINNTFFEVIKHDAVIPAISMVPTIRTINGNFNKSVNRNDFKIIQTPQVFKSEVIKKAYTTPYQPSFFDDATVAEYCGYNIKIIEGNNENIKITLPIDYITAKALNKSTLQHDISH